MTETDIQNTTALSAQVLTQDKAQAYELVGMIKAFGFTKKLVTVTEIKILQEIKETKKYKGLELITPTGETVTVTTFTQFCKCLGMSYEKVNQDLQNLNTFGEDFLETSQRLGLGYREMRKLRQLPDEAKAEIVDADYSETSDKEELLEKIEDLTALYTKEKGELEKKLKRKTDDYEAQGKVLANKTEQINRLDMELAKKTKLFETMLPDQKGGFLRDEVTRLAYKVEALLRAEVWKGFEALQAHTAAEHIDHSQFMSGVLAELKLALNQLEDQFNVPESADGDLTPEWARDDGEELDFTAELERIKNGKIND